MMKFAKLVTLFAVLVALAACQKTTAERKVLKPCTKETCLNDPDCLCWCSQMCGWRKKIAEDNPIYIENDKFGKFCYCKQWDYDHYEDNCINHKDVKQAPGAK